MQTYKHMKYSRLKLINHNHEQSNQERNIQNKDKNMKRRNKKKIQSISYVHLTSIDSHEQ